MSDGLRSPSLIALQAINRQACASERQLQRELNHPPTDLEII
jgi:hypothetical protein